MVKICVEKYLTNFDNLTFFIQIKIILWISFCIMSTSIICITTDRPKSVIYAIKTIATININATTTINPIAATEIFM